MSNKFSEYSTEQLESIEKAVREKKTLLLSANWGVGKTHFIRNLLQDRFSNHKIRYVSLFGIESLDRLIQKLLEPKINLENQTFEILGKTLPLSDLNSIMNGGANLLISQINNEIIVLDDLERSNLDYTLVLGLIDKIKENNSIIFICNRNKIQEADFLNQIEKVSDRIVDNLKVDFNEVMKKIIPQSILEDVLYSFFIMKEDNLRIAIKLSQYFKLIENQIPYLSYKEVRLFCCLAIEKIKHGYLNEFYDAITIDPFKKIELYLYNRDIRVNKNIEKKFKIRQECVEIQSEVLRPEFESFLHFLKAINEEQFYHLRPSLVEFIRHEFLEEKNFNRQIWAAHPSFKDTQLSAEVLYPKDLIESNNEKQLQSLDEKIKNVIQNFRHHMSGDNLTNFNILYHLIASHCEISNSLETKALENIKLDLFSELIEKIQDSEIKLIKHPESLLDSFKGVQDELKLIIGNERNQRKYKKIYDIFESENVVEFYKNNYNEELFDFLNDELLGIVANKYLMGSRLGKEVVTLMLKDSYVGDKQEKRDKSALTLKKLLEKTQAELQDKIVKKRITTLLSHPLFNKVAVSIPKTSTKPEEKNISEDEYTQAIEELKKVKKNTPRHEKLKNFIIQYKTQQQIAQAARAEYLDLDEVEKEAVDSEKDKFFPGARVRFISRRIEYRTIADIGAIYTLKAKVKFKNNLLLWTTEELGDWSVSELDLEKL